MKRVVVVPLSALLLAACSETPTEPARAKTLAPASMSLTSSSGVVMDFSADFGRISNDVVPGFADAKAGQALQGYLADISTAIAAGDKAEAGRVLALARTVVTPATVNDGDRGYIDLVFRDLDAALQ